MWRGAVLLLAETLALFASSTVLTVSAMACEGGPPPPTVEQVDFTNNQAVLVDHQNNATGEDAIGISEFGDLNEVEWQSTGDAKSWPVVFVRKAKAKLTARFKLEKATEEFIEKKLEAGSKAKVVGNLTLGGSALEFKGELTKAELEAHKGFFITKEMESGEFPDKILVGEGIPIAWKWELKESGQPLIKQGLGSSTHNFYLTYAAPVADKPIYLTLLDAATQGAEKEAQPPTEAGVIKGTWSAFKALALKLRWYGVGTGTLHRGGTVIKYYEQQNTETKDLKEIVEKISTTCAIEPLADMLKEAEGKCGAWAQAFAVPLANEGIKSKIWEIGSEFTIGEEDKCSVFKACTMLIKKWKFEGLGSSGNADFPYRATEVKDEKGVPAQGVENPPAYFLNHYIVEAPKASGKLYDPSYGTGPYEGANPLKEFQEGGIAGFCGPFNGASEAECQVAPTTLELDKVLDEELN